MFILVICPNRTAHIVHIQLLQIVHIATAMNVATVYDIIRKNKMSVPSNFITPGQLTCTASVFYLSRNIQRVLYFIFDYQTLIHLLCL